MKCATQSSGRNEGFSSMTDKYKIFDFLTAFLAENELDDIAQQSLALAWRN